MNLDEDFDDDIEEDHDNDSSNFNQSLGYDQPCDLRLLIPDTCLKEFISKTVEQKFDTAGLLPSLGESSANANNIGTSCSSSSGITNNNNNNKHCLTRVTVGGAYKCSQCGNSYARPHSLNRHVRFECGVEPQFECPVCHKKSKHKHNLVLHMRTHKNL